VQATLRNDSDTTLSSLAGTLASPTPGVSVLDADATWPDLAAFASAVTLPDHFGFRVSRSTACGTTLELDVSTTAAEGSWSGRLFRLVGMPGATYGEFPSTDVPRTIADVATTLSTLSIADAGAVLDVNVGLTLTHTYDGDLDLYLRGPDGTRVELTTDNGSSGDGYTDTIFDDEAAISITSGTAPFTGSYRPEGLLSAFDGLPAVGTWTLEVTDDAPNDVGVLTAWSLRLTTETPPTCHPCAAPLPPPGEAGASVPLTLSKSGADLVLDWGWPPNPCAPTGYSLYRGTLGSLAAGAYDHDVAVACDLASPTLRLPIGSPLLGDASYFVAVADNGEEEGSYGRASSGAERPVSAAACKPAQNLSACP
jgi:subtilisin-like proprotein convertase family protein